MYSWHLKWMPIVSLVSHRHNLLRITFTSVLHFYSNDSSSFHGLLNLNRFFYSNTFSPWVLDWIINGVWCIMWFLQGLYWEGVFGPSLSRSCWKRGGWRFVSIIRSPAATVVKGTGVGKAWMMGALICWSWSRTVGSTVRLVGCWTGQLVRCLSHWLVAHVCFAPQSLWLIVGMGMCIGKLLGCLYWNGDHRVCRQYGSGKGIKIVNVRIREGITYIIATGRQVLASWHDRRCT